MVKSRIRQNHGQDAATSAGKRVGDIVVLGYHGLGVRHDCSYRINTVSRNGLSAKLEKIGITKERDEVIGSWSLWPGSHAPLTAPKVNVKPRSGN